ncbi:MAG: TIGR04086 family membrane protein [Thermacetogeniaceae bacterium]|jgi:putative membrane protein (TIGR04086 family)|nr:TIGR04086 family membrane protein [Syntrophomonadaceae bacterium]
MDSDKNPFFRLAENPVIYGTGAALILGIFCVILLSIIFHFTSISELYLKPIGTFCFLVGGFFGGFLASKMAGGKGLVYGAEVGLCYYLIFILIFLLISPGSISASAAVIKGFFTILVSAAGGICGLAYT